MDRGERPVFGDGPLSTLRRVCALAVIAAAFACDPVTENAVSALGGEVPGVPHGPLHRPGQPCLLCHGNFSVAGTVYEKPSSPIGLAGAVVSLTDSTQQTYVFEATNEAGNFYVKNDDWSPVFPLSHVTVTVPGVKPVKMLSDIGRNGGCGSCHLNPAGPASAGHVCIALDDGGTPP